MTAKNRIQEMVIRHLLKEGSLEILLPNGITLEMGVTQENSQGNLEIADDYAWVIASQEDRSVSLDSYNLGLRFSNHNDKMLVDLEDSVDYKGDAIRILQCA